MSKTQVMLWSSTIAIGILLVLAVGQLWASPLAAPNADPVRVCTWLGCKPGALSYSQDDASNVNGATSCRPALEAAGFHGTFFFDGTRVTTTWMADYVTAGHEIGSHLADHLKNFYAPACGNSCTLTGLRETPYSQTLVDEFRADQIDPSVTVIESATGRPVIAMAYPYGATDANRMAASDLYFLGARGYFNPDVANFPWVTDINTATLAEPMLLNSDNGWNMVAFVERAISENKWAIFTMHDYCYGIGEDGNYLDSMRDALWVAPVGEVLKYIKVRDAARFGNYLEGYSSISFDAGHSLSTLQRQTYTGTALLPIVFDNPVTLNADLPANKGVWQVLVDSVPVSYAISGTVDGAHSVMFTTTLGITRHVTISLTNATAVQLQDFSARSDTDLGQNLGWLIALIVMGTSGLAGLMKANRRQPRRTAMRGRD